MLQNAIKITVAPLNTRKGLVKCARGNDFVIEDRGFVDVKNWKYLKPVSIIVVICTIVVHIIFSPLGIG